MRTAAAPSVERIPPRSIVLPHMLLVGSPSPWSETDFASVPWFSSPTPLVFLTHSPSLLTPMVPSRRA